MSLNLMEIIRGVITQTKKIDVEILPTQGLFYNQDFEIKIKKAEMEDIIDYEVNYNNQDLYTIIESVKKIVRNNTIFNKNYKFDDIKSVDIVYVFFEIVKFTTKLDIEVPYLNNSNKVDIIKFDRSNFNYFDFNKYIEFHNKESADISIDGWKFTMPSIGVENCLTQFLIEKSKNKDSKKWIEMDYDFLFFIGNKNYLTFDEIENLAMIFNVDIEEVDQTKIKSIIKQFMSIVNYSLKIDEKIIDVKSKIDLETIWKI